MICDVVVVAVVVDDDVAYRVRCWNSKPAGVF